MKRETISTINYIRATQIMIEKGWKFIDNGYPRIEKAINESTGEEIEFSDNNEFIMWLYDNNLEIF